MTMLRRTKHRIAIHSYGNILILNQWIISLFGIDPLSPKYRETNRKPFHDLTKTIRDPGLEGLDSDNLHRFYRYLGDLPLFSDTQRPGFHIAKDDLARYEENIVHHTQAINEYRHQKITWKYFQWLSLLFAEIYLDRYFNNRLGLLQSLNDYVRRFNAYWPDFEDVPSYTVDDLNKICLQNATGSGKTLLMHVNVLQFRHYAEKSGQADRLSRVILITPNENLSAQHLAEFRQSNIRASRYTEVQSLSFGQSSDLKRVDVTEITKLADQQGPNTIATSSLGDQNLLLVDEGHRGMSGSDEGVWIKRRNALTAKGFTFEYSATFQQAVAASGNKEVLYSYAKTILFDYSYRWFYEDGFGKDYMIINLPGAYDSVRKAYMTACLLKYYQQLLLYSDKSAEYHIFNIEKPLWVFVGSTVIKGATSDERKAVADVAQIIHFLAWFLDKREEATEKLRQLLEGDGSSTGMMDSQGNDIFAGAFAYLIEKSLSPDAIYKDISARLFQNPGEGHLTLHRIKGDSGEILLYSGISKTAFGLISVGDAKGLADHIEATSAGMNITVKESDFSEPLFATVKESSSPINIVIGAKKFIEGWDTWRVSTLGLMHVGKSEGTQIIQLFGRGVRLKGYEWSLKRSAHSRAPFFPKYIQELELLNVFGIEANYMQEFRNFLKEQGLPGNEKRIPVQIPLNVTSDFGHKLMILAPKRKREDGSEYDFKRDGAVPKVGVLPDDIYKNPVQVDWYPRLDLIQSRKTTAISEKEQVRLNARHLTLIDYEKLWLDLEEYKRTKSWHNLNIRREDLKALLSDSNWYRLFISPKDIEPSGYQRIQLLQQVITEMLKRYIDKIYEYHRRAYIEPRLEYRELTRENELLPADEYYQLIVDSNEDTLLKEIEAFADLLKDKSNDLIEFKQMKAIYFDRHLYQPLLFSRNTSRITIRPVALNESEFQFVSDLKRWYDREALETSYPEHQFFLLRNLSRGKGVGFFEAGSFYPDFLLWIIKPSRQYLTFIEPHGLRHEGIASEKIRFSQYIKEIEKRLANPNITLNSFVLSWTPFPQLKWDTDLSELEKQHVLFMTDDADNYIEKMITATLKTK
jgi:hypothetical protein